MHVLIPIFSRVLADRYKDLCKDEVGNGFYVGLQALLTYFAFQFTSACELMREHSWTISHSQFLAMLEQIPANRFMKRMRSSVLRKYKGVFNLDNFVFVIDDTDNPKFAKNLDSVSNWRCSKGGYRGQKIQVLSLVDIEQGFAIPISYSFILPKPHPDHVKGTEIAVDLVKEAIADGFPKFDVVCDSWFDSSDMATAFRNMGVTYYWNMKSNRNVKTNPGKYVKWQKLKPAFSKRVRVQVHKRNSRKGKSSKKWIATAHLRLTTLKNPVKAIAVFNRKNSKDAFNYYACTDVSVSGEKIWLMGRYRWEIECLFHALKQSLSFGKLKCSGENASDLAVVIPFIILTALRLEPEIFGFSKGKTVGEMLKTLEKQEQERNLNFILSYPNHPKVAVLKERKKNVVTKPVGTRCGKITALKTRVINGKCAA